MINFLIKGILSSIRLWNKHRKPKYYQVIGLSKFEKSLKAKLRYEKPKIRNDEDFWHLY